MLNSYKFFYSFKVKIVLIIISVLLCLVFSLKVSANSKNNGVILCDNHGEIIYSQNINQAFIPASTLKILTSLGAIYYLGEDFRFKTEFFLDKNLNLKIKGYGDPHLTSENINNFCRDLALILKKKNVFIIKSIIIDNSFFSSSIKIPGTQNSLNPYDASVGAFCVNFNTIFFKYNLVKNKFISAEKETPLTPFAKKIVQESNLKHGRIVISKEESQIYAGVLARYFLEKQGIIISEKVKLGIVQKNDKKIFTYKSFYNLKNIIKKLLKFSNNFMANQIFLTIGAKAFSPPATLAKGIKAMENYAGNELNIKKIKIVEGSGISRKNRISPKEMLKILKGFKKYYYLMNNRKNEYFKTGTLNKICTRAGYYTNKNMKLYPFVIMVNKEEYQYRCNHIIGNLQRIFNKIIN
ncbi:MAG: hypothetical protein B6I26_05185 [Desulfobacteraceae bacterium 4572_130]|nr:MAG: hypothetical protein B6I26_05185 [Desulfobacteraceae bacterium 4572_130]